MGWEVVGWGCHSVCTLFVCRLAGMGHWDIAVAQGVAQQCLHMYDDCIDSDPIYIHHAQSISFLSPASPLRAQVVEFASGLEMGDALRQEVDKLVFIPVVERSIEAKHALIKRKSGKHFRTGRFVSLTLRIPDVKEDIRRDMKFFTDLVSAFELTRNAKTAAALLGIDMHPSLVVARRLSASQDVLFSLLNRIVYRGDFESKFEDKTESRKMNDREANAQLRKGAAVLKRKDRGEPQKLTYDQVQLASMVEHFRQVVDQCRFYSLELRPGEGQQAPRIMSVDGVLDVPPSKIRRSCTLLSLG